MTVLSRRVADWVYLEPLLGAGCTSTICQFDGRAWAARTNDIYAQEPWGCVTVRDPFDRIPWISFCREGDVSFADRSEPRAAVAALPFPSHPRVLHAATPRYGATLLFAVDGTTEEFAAFECEEDRSRRRAPLSGWIVAANHRSARTDADPPVDHRRLGTGARYRPGCQLVAALCTAVPPADIPRALRQVLPDDEIEDRGLDLATAYSCVACPSTREIWYAFGGQPAASHCSCQRLAWPW
jgi:hypothetical protein